MEYDESYLQHKNRRGVIVEIDRGEIVTSLSLVVPMNLIVLWH